MSRRREDDDVQKISPSQICPVPAPNLQKKTYQLSESSVTLVFMFDCYHATNCVCIHIIEDPLLASSQGFPYGTFHPALGSQGMSIDPFVLVSHHCFPHIPTKWCIYTV